MVSSLIVLFALGGQRASPVLPTTLCSSVRGEGVKSVEEQTGDQFLPCLLPV